MNSVSDANVAIRKADDISRRRSVSPAPRRRRRRSHSRGRRRDSRSSSSSSAGRHKSRRKEKRSLSEDSEKGLSASALQQKRELEELSRDSRTVCITQLQMKAEEKDIKKFFSAVCKVKSVNVLRDRNNRRSKGIAYVELKTIEDIPLALMLSNQNFIFRNGKKGFPVVVKASEAEKNFTHKMQKREQQLTSHFQGSNENNRIENNRIAISSLDSSLTEKDIREICSAFGNVYQVYYPQNSSQGVAWVTFSTSSEAKTALSSLPYQSIKGIKPNVKMSQRDEQHANEKVSWRLDDDSRDMQGNGGIAMTPETRATLMSNLAGGAGSEILSSILPPAAKEVDIVHGEISVWIMVQNMFDPSQETQIGWEKEIEDEVKDECSKYGKVISCKIDKTSQGNVFLEFGTVAQSQAAASALHGRWFDRRQLVATFLNQGAYTAYASAIANQ